MSWQVGPGLSPISPLVRRRRLGCDAGGIERRRHGAKQRPDDRLHHCTRPTAPIRRKKGSHQESIGRSRGGQTTKIHLRTNSIGLPIAVTLSSGQTSDYTLYEPLMLEARPEPKLLIADKGYDSDAIHEDLIARTKEPVIATRRNRKAQEPIDGAIYALRNLIECCFNKRKHSRRLATRYDKSAESYFGFVLMTSARLWCRHFVNTGKRCCRRPDQSRSRFWKSIIDCTEVVYKACSYSTWLPRGV